MLSRSTRSILTRASKAQPAAIRMYSSSEGSVGSTRSDGSSDAFTKREKAQEDLYVKQHEKEQLAQLREQLKQQQKKIDNLEEKLDNIRK
ncbi:unnamed protein product [Kluyveromyces dobzhanskii CBS 2104]|uniref:ATPase inhibitor, mitochondrial n=1 Tax=Kluyveromyces dobzhanskii CBS 2104 TaxID=1427455 RepID=A0A0A8LBU2_9SACH|nr:unnamed protein product [Kluyveromyces dobzhanskii CBS 2104]